jgi:hypothetical protein
MRRAQVLASTLLLVACTARTQIDTLEGQVVVGQEHSNWTPIDDQRPPIFDGTQGLKLQEAVGVAVDFSAFSSEGDNRLVELEGPWTMVSDDPAVAEAFSGPNNTIAIIGRAPGNAVLTLTLVGIVESVEVPIEVVAAEDFEPTVDGAGGEGGGA